MCQLLLDLRSHNLLNENDNKRRLQAKDSAIDIDALGERKRPKHKDMNEKAYLSVALCCHAKYQHRCRVQGKIIALPLCHVANL